MSFTRRKVLTASALTAGACAIRGLFGNTVFGADGAKTSPRPVILATDIGGDIDDTWALALLLKSPELDLKLAVTDYGVPLYRGKILAKFLQTTGHGQTPIGLGPEYDDAKHSDGALARQAPWVKDYDLEQYKGPVHHDGAKAIVEVIMRSPQRVTVISIGPPPTVAAALAIEPRIA